MSNEREDIEMNIKKLRELKKNKKGFTLIEIIVVIVILAVLMAVAVPSVLKYLNEADNAKYEAQARAVMTAAQAETVKQLVTADGIADASELKNIKDNIVEKSGIAGLNANNITLYSAKGTTITGEGDDTITYDGTVIDGQTPVKSDTVSDLPAVKVSLPAGSGKTIDALIVLNDKVYLGKVH